jgi:very-short-patch-repair endonuclease
LKEGWPKAGVVDYIFDMNRDNHLFNRKELGSYRSALRKNLTSAEASLWNLLKNRQVSGCKFRRQHSIGNYIVDFCCPAKMLIIELDGNVHGEAQQIVRDEVRDDYLKKLGFTVLRFENRFVFQDPEFVIDEIKKCLIGKYQI